MNYLNCAFFFLASLTLTACNGDDGLLGGPDLGYPIVGLQVTPATASILVGLHQQYEATAIMSDGSTEDVTTHLALSWSSSDPAIATVNIATGLATGVMPGEATITASGIANGVEFNQTAMLTVTDAIIISVAVTSDVESVAAGLPVAFTATATLSDSTTHIATQDGEEVNWTIVSQPGEHATIDTLTGILTTASDSVGEITVRAQGISTTWNDMADKTITVTDAIIISVAVTSDVESVAAGLPIAFTATATLSDNTTHIATQDGEEVNWTIVSQPGENATIDTNTGILTTALDSVGEITVRAKGISTTWNDMADKTITVTEFELLMCGDEVNNNDKTNAVGDCLKVATDVTGMLFTGTPSLAAMTALKYVQADGDEDINGGKTYVSIFTENGTYGPTGSFGRFDQQLIGGDNASSILEEGVNGQYDRWCNNLGDINFNERNDWRRASEAELLSFFSDRGNIYDRYGWATSIRYWSSTVTGSFFSDVRLYDGNTSFGNPSTIHNAACVSDLAGVIQ